MQIDLEECIAEKKQKDIGEHCVDCFKDTSYGKGRFVNRIPADNENYIGFLCADCQMIECDKCKSKALDYEIIDGEFLCENCLPDEERKDNG